jgi:hypothetical protein
VRVLKHLALAGLLTVIASCAGCGGCDPRVVEDAMEGSPDDFSNGPTDAGKSDASIGAETPEDAGLDVGAIVDAGADVGADGGFDAGGPTPCATKQDCVPDRWCEVTSGECLPMGTCSNHEQCAFGHLCNSFTTACECIGDETCAGWPGETVLCHPVYKKCMENRCEPPCRPYCEECVHSNCVYAAGKDCCDDRDCSGYPGKPICNEYTLTCRPQVCTDPCATDKECENLCGGPQYKCASGRCEGECVSDLDCAAYCSSGSGKCQDALCQCDPDFSQLCADCSSDSNACARAGLMCGLITKQCQHQCQTQAGCTDKNGNLYPCNFGGFCACTPTCCNPACEPPKVCDEGKTCTCN